MLHKLERGFYIFDNYIIDSWQKGVLYLVTLVIFALIFYTGRLKLMNIF